MATIRRSLRRMSGIDFRSRRDFIGGQIAAAMDAIWNDEVNCPRLFGAIRRLEESIAAHHRDEAVMALLTTGQWPEEMDATVVRGVSQAEWDVVLAWEAANPIAAITGVIRRYDSEIDQCGAEALAVLWNERGFDANEVEDWILRDVWHPEDAQNLAEM